MTEFKHPMGWTGFMYRADLGPVDDVYAWRRIGVTYDTPPGLDTTHLRYNPACGRPDDPKAWSIDLDPVTRTIPRMSNLAKQSYSNMDKSVVDSMLDTKPTNPKDGFGSEKAPLSTLSMPVVYEMALAMLDGGCKYRRHNYRIAGVRVSVYYDAAMRHINSWWEGQELDEGHWDEDGEFIEGSGLPHLAHAMACLMIIRDGQIFENCTDDRPPSAPAKWLSFMNQQAKRIVKKYKGGKPPHVIGELK